MLNMPVAVFDHPALLRAKRSVMRNSLRRQSNLQWIRRTRVDQMVKWVKSNKFFDKLMMLFLFAYCFLLRWAMTSLASVACRHP